MLQSSPQATTTTARRSTRVSRIYTNSSAQAAPKSRRKGKRREFTTTKASTRRWAQVLRPPQSGVHFKTLTWVPLERLTAEERKKYDENERIKAEKKRKKPEQCKETLPFNNMPEVDTNESVPPTICKNIVSITLKGDPNDSVTSSDEHGDQSQNQRTNIAGKQNFMEEEGANMNTEISPKRSKHDTEQNTLTLKCEQDTNSNISNNTEGSILASMDAERNFTSIPDENGQKECSELKQKLGS